MSEEEIKAIEYFEDKIKNKLPLYEETYVDGKPYRRNILQLETNFTEEQANKTEILLNLIDKLQKENDNLNKKNKRYGKYLKNKDIEHEKVLEYIETEKERDYISKDIIRNKIKELEEEREKTPFTFPISKVIYFLKQLLGSENNERRMERY